MQTFNMGRVPPVVFGAGCLAKAPKIAATLNSGPVFIVADAVLAELGVTDRLTRDFAAKGIAAELAADVSGEPKEALIDELCARARQVGAKAVIGLGGGAAMDTAKLVAAIANADQPAETFSLAAQPLPAKGLRE